MTDAVSINWLNVLNDNLSLKINLIDLDAVVSAYTRYLKIFKTYNKDTRNTG